MYNENYIFIFIFFMFIFFSNNKSFEKMSSMADLIINTSNNQIENIQTSLPFDIKYKSKDYIPYQINDIDNYDNNSQSISFDDLYKKLIYYQVTPYSIPSKKNNINDSKNTIYDKDIKYYNLDAMFDKYNLHLDDKYINLYT